MEALGAVASRLALGDVLAAVRHGTVALPRVERAGLPLLAFLLRERAGSKARAWVVADGVRQQEQIHDELIPLLPEAILLPETLGMMATGSTFDPELVADQLHATMRLAAGATPEIAVVTRTGWEGEVFIARGQRAEPLVLRPAESPGIEHILAALGKAGFERVPQVGERLQFAVRGGLLDIFAADQLAPVRVEWFGDEIESIREFDIHSQVSNQELDEVRLTLASAEDVRRAPLQSLVRGDDLVFEALGKDSAGGIAVALGQRPARDAETIDESLSFFDLSPRADVWWQDEEVGREVGRQRALAQLQFWARDGIKFLVTVGPHEREIFAQVKEAFAPLAEAITWCAGQTGSALLLREAGVAILPAGLVFGHRVHHAVGTRANWLSRRGAAIRRTAAEAAETFDEGDLVVHEEHGIARFRGLEPAPEGGSRLALEFAGEAKIYVPLEQSHLVARYQGLGKQRPALSRLGEARWATSLRSAERATADYAARLLKLQAVRETESGTAFPVDSDWQSTFEAAFPFQETPDQIRAISETKRDLESRRPMDRLICGDVGFGKTEVAIRAAFKAAAAGRQVALLAPTTVLAQQHFENWRKRFADYPIRVDVLTRFRSAAEQREVIRDVGRGAVDVVIGTHRLISDDVAFRDLGLLIVDEEQRFGVKHKERLKERYPLVDILTLSATPIPRTLYMALTGARDMSVLETPPPSRYPVETTIGAYDERVIREAITRELAREGQVFFLHNRIATIERTAQRVTDLCPGARVEIGHGQMDEDELDAVMHRFIAGETDVLVSTTIIESGIDIPNANTIIIDRADRFGLADLYQLRGRVGRGTHRAYAFLMLPRELMSVGAARKRIEAIRQYSALGAGFQIAMRDLEIRGAGNLLGLSQSGHITAVGFHLYCQMLEQAVAALRGRPAPRRAEVPLQLDFLELREGIDTKAAGTLPAFLPLAYVSDERQRMEIFRRLGNAASADAIKSLRAQMRDRFGRLPGPAENLLSYHALRVLAADRKIESLAVRGDKLIIERGGEPLQIEGRFPRLKSEDAKSRFSEIIQNVRSL